MHGALWSMCRKALSTAYLQRKVLVLSHALAVQILFQQLARTNPIKLEHLLQSLSGLGGARAGGNEVAGMEDG
eukprot:1161823-Pelagomonas_calceolata.AAC.3